MPIIVTRKWSTYVWGDTRALIEFEVSGVPSGAAGNAAAKAAVPFQKGATFESDSTLVMANAPEVQGDFGLRKVTCEFTRSDAGNGGGGGGGGGPTPEQLLALPAKIQWGSAQYTEPTDRSYDGYAIRNAAGDTYSPKPNTTIDADTVAITKYLPAFPFLVRATFRGAVNSEPVSVTNSPITFHPRTIKCLGITAPEYSADAQAIPCTLQLEIRVAHANYNFHLAILNQGRNGWYRENNVVKKGRITDTSGQDVTDDVLLTSDGKPVDSAYKVNNQTPVANPNAVNGYVPDPDAKSPALVQLWQMQAEMDFGPLFQAMNI